MKKILFILLSFFFTLSLMAQHISFLGKPIGCDITEFKQRMIARNYVSNGEVENGVYSFNGMFGGYNTLIAAYLTSKSKVVYSVGVFYKDFTSNEYYDNSLETQKNQYNLINDALINKYGIPSSTKDLFSLWDVEYGEIILTVNPPDKYGNRQLILWYRDYDGLKKRDEENASDY